MTNILIIEDMAVLREPIAAMLTSSGYRTLCAANGREALQIFRNQTIDLILLDIAMPVMNGIEFLRAMRRERPDDAPPVILLTALGDKQYVIEAAKLGVREYLLKSQFSFAELNTRMKRVLSKGGDSSSCDGLTTQVETETGDESSSQASSLESSNGNHDHASKKTLKSMKSLMVKSDVMKHLESCGELKAMSPTVGRVLELSRSESCTIDRIAKVIKQDQAIALKVLRLANSAAYTRGEPVDSIDRAVQRIGLKEIYQAVLNIAVIDNLSGDADSHIDLGQFWEHSIGCGIIASELVRENGAEAGDLAFTMGLMHDVGRLIFAQQCPEVYQEVIETADRLELPLEQVETRLLTINHADGMDRVLHRWNFAKDLIEPIVFHHLSVGNIRRVAPRRLSEVAVLGLANRLCHGLAIGSSGNKTLYETEEFFEILQVSDDLAAHIEATARDQTNSLKLALLAADKSGGWIDTRQHFSEQLQTPCRPLFICSKPSFDAFRMFCDQLRDASDEPPNIAVVHVTQPRDRQQLIDELIKQEADLELPSLPLLEISASEKTLRRQEFRTGRRVAQLNPPVRVERFLNVVQALLNENAKASSQAA